MINGQNNLYTNKVFLQNTIHFLMGEIQRLNLRSKEIRLTFLDITLVNEEKQAIQLKVLGFHWSLWRW